MSSPNGPLTASRTCSPERTWTTAGLSVTRIRRRTSRLAGCRRSDFSSEPESTVSVASDGESLRSVGTRAAARVEIPSSTSITIKSRLAAISKERERERASRR
jgi:hypothetical protein